MEFRLARRTRDLRASEIREILKVTAHPEVISFAGGLPAAEVFPVAEIAEATVAVLAEEGHRPLQYSPTEGDVELRDFIARRMTQRDGRTWSARDVLITSGSQQGLDLTGKLLLDEGSTVLCESPTYLGAINAFRAYSPKFAEVATDDQGMIPEALEATILRAEDPRFVYVVPDFQNPTGRTWSLERRHTLLEVAGRHALPVVEDAPYSEVRFEGRPLPSLASLDHQGLVVHLGTFSKIMCPGLRIGWLMAPTFLVDRYVLVKQGADLHTSTLSQRQIARYLRDHDLDAAIARIRSLYRARRDAMLTAIDRHFPPGFLVTRPEGGLFLWVELPPRCNARDLLVASLEQRVAFVPGGSFFPNGGHENTMRLNFSAMPEDRITEGIRRLGRVLREELQTTRPSRSQSQSSATIAG